MGVARCGTAAVRAHTRSTMRDSQSPPRSDVSRWFRFWWESCGEGTGVEVGLDEVVAGIEEGWGVARWR